MIDGLSSCAPGEFELWMSNGMRGNLEFNLLMNNDTYLKLSVDTSVRRG